jgi:hypothetical protein
MEVFKIIPGNENNAAALDALKEHIKTLDNTLSYAKMINYRVNGYAAEECNDIYYVAVENGKFLSRLWNGWGKHKNAIGNFGNFYTDITARGKGIGGTLLSKWYEDISACDNAPLALFCSAGSKELVSLYKKHGFSLAVRNTETGPLYKPLNDSPDNFEAFCKKYYKPSDVLFSKKATVEYRHEIDLLLKFALLDLGLTFGFAGVSSLEEVLMLKENCDANILFTNENVVAGWQFVDESGKVYTQVYPIYTDAKIITT